MKIVRSLFISAILFCLFLPATAQTIKTYAAEWKAVDVLIKERKLPKSALEEVKEIYAMAKRDRQDAQVIKALVYMTRLQQENRLDNLTTSIQELEKEIPLNREPAVSILKSYVATLYWQYFQNYRWQLYNRTNTVDFNKDDIATWTIEDFQRRISQLYLESVSQPKLLQQTPLAPYDAIITKGNTRPLRPTLYDLLAHQALNYFKNNERDLKKPAYSFQIDSPAAFAPAAEFVKHRFVTPDSLSLQHRALLIYQDLTVFHLNDAKPDALLDVNIERLQFVHQNAIIADKDELYIAALRHIMNKYGTTGAAAQASFLLAAWYHERAARYQPGTDTTHQNGSIIARDLLLRVVRDSVVKTEGWTNSFNLLREIESTHFLFELEKVSAPQKPFRALVRYKNLNSMHFRLVAATAELKTLLENYREDRYWPALLNAPSIRTWEQPLPPANDFLHHAVEVKVDALPVGEYILLASPRAGFNGGRGTIGAQLFYVSNISYVVQGRSFFVLNRETGQPLAHAAVALYAQEHNYNTSRYIKQKKGDYRTDKNGFFQLPGDQIKERGYYLEIRHNSDRLFLQDAIYNYFYNGDTRSAPAALHTFYFTDRSIYRPGQTVYFKGLVIRRTADDNQVAANHRTTVYLRNANYEVADSIQVTTNEFGTYNGRFTLPQSVLNGQFTIGEKDGNSAVNFSVEEYKRPRFYASFDTLKATYKVDDTIVVTGSAKSYAGNNIDNATVVYRVVRQPRFPYPWLRRIWPVPGEPMEIAHGTVTTGDDGTFRFQFVALPDKKIDRSTDPLFDYRVHIDVTDMGGETRSADHVITAGYKSLVLDVNLPEKISTDSLKQLVIRTHNMNGAFVPSTVQVAFYPLLPEQRLVRKRYWQQPDKFIMSKELFLQHFPTDEYRNETDFKTWPRGEAVFRKTETTTTSGAFLLTGMSVAPGFYAVEVTTRDRESAEVKDLRYMEVYDENTRQLSRPEYLWAKGSRPLEPGERTTVQIGSSAPDVFLIKQEDHTKSPLWNRYDREGLSGELNTGDIDFTSLDNEKKTFAFTATEKDRGGYGVTYFFVKDNRLHQFNDIIRVPWTNKELNIEYATFRNKMLPGSKEQWKIRITGSKKEVVSAEMLASMYDASLDAFRHHQWISPHVWPVYARTLNWQGIQAFASVQAMQTNDSRNVYRSFEKRYDRFIFDQMHNGVYAQTVGMRRSMTAPAPTMEAADGRNASAVVNQDLRMGHGMEIQEEKQAGNPPPLVTPVDQTGVQMRRDFSETAFFFPELRTDKDGNIEFTFTVPEAVTRWKLQTLAHTKQLAFGMAQQEIVTQKELMVQPTMPRFLRQGDRIELSSKIVNLSTGALNGNAELLLFDATNNAPVDRAFLHTNTVQPFRTTGGSSAVVKYAIQVPQDFTGVLTWRIVARANATADGTVWSDGEEAAIPVLTNRMLVTETMPLPMRGAGTKTFPFDKLLQAGGSTSLQHHALTVEYTSNPAWFAVQAIPFLTETPAESAEQAWNRYYAASLATKIVASAPRIRAVFERWKTLDTSALLSKLQKNQELKSALLEETPWVLQAKSEEQQKKNIALLFDMVRMRAEMASAYQKLKSMQTPNGGFVWVKGGPEDWYMTQYIVTGIGHLVKLDAISRDQQDEMNSILQTAIPYLDRKMKEDYDRLVRDKLNTDIYQPQPIHVQYLYMRSFFPSRAVAAAHQTADRFYQTQAARTWTKQNKYVQGMIALALHRAKNTQTPIDILRSLKETAILSEEMSMYWQDQRYGFNWNWWYAPVETQALLIEAFTEITKDTKAIDDMRLWLIKHKQTNHWRTTKATAEAVYAFLLQGTEWLTAEPVVRIQLGTHNISSSDQSGEAGTGYFKQTIDAAAVQPSMGRITVNVDPPVNASTQVFNAPSWGAAYWQYFEDLDKITIANTPLQVSKKLFVETNTDRGPVITPITTNSSLKVGSKVKVRIEIRTDRDMEYVHMKDLRSSAFEPVNVLSGYRWQGGLGYYETKKDVSTSFYFPFLRRGTYVFEYTLFVTHAGQFSNGITSVQSMYAPEFAAHSEGVRVKVESL